MNRPQKILCMIYATLSLVALIACWSENIAYLPQGPWQGLQDFLQDLTVNPAIRSISRDLLLLTISCSVWMIYESRRLGIKHSWAYIVFGFIIAISCTFPLFLIAREKALTLRRSHEN